MFCTVWPNARNIFIIFNATRQCSCAPGPWRARSGPNAHALAQHCCVNVAKRVQHHATSKMLYEKFDRFQIWSNIIQHVATYCNISQHGGQTYATCCAQHCCKLLRWKVASVWPGLNTKADLPNYCWLSMPELAIFSINIYLCSIVWQGNLNNMVTLAL